MKKIYLLFLLAGLALAAEAQLLSPEQFLGYPVGSKYTPHYRIVQYFQHVAQQLPNQVKLEQFGQTNEGRPLLLATIASPENFSRLEQIRQNNLRMAHLNNDQQPVNDQAPAIVWLSYNVHGNETSSSEASMLTLYELANPANQKSRQWLQNTIVLIDPCLNPDGRDRYVNWYTTVIGNRINLSPQAREHREPWPGGRTNHYYFDLNRDWAWQTQQESRARVKQYNAWLPQVHVDFHEQGFNEPYYFAPAAEPYHEVITKWQRDFQVSIGKNNARYFDQNGWLYFTKLRFDLFYPSYGDTYPIYSGSIGMTFEQGGIRAGLGILNEDGDTLSLRARVLHHFTTSISTVEISSLNASKLVQEFRNYFDKTISNPPGEFKSWLIRNDGTDRVSRLKELLDRNAINWLYANAGTTFTGLNYFTGKQETTRAENGDLVINANQTKGNLIKVLFERNSRLSDSITYDITAWSVPFAYGLKTYGIAGYTNGKKQGPANETSATPDANAYAYAIKWDGFNSAKFLSAILQKGIKIRYSEQAFVAGGEQFAPGTLIITRTSNEFRNFYPEVSAIAHETGTKLYPILSGFVDQGADMGSDRVHIINAPKVALIYGESVFSLNYGEIWQFFDQQLGYPFTAITANDFLQGGLNTYNVLILADGNYDFFNRKDQNDELKNWVRRGGKIIAIGNVVAQMARSDWGIKNKDGVDTKSDASKSPYSDLKRFENRERDEQSSGIPGSIYRLDLDNSHPLGFGYPDYYFTLKQDANMYDFLKDGGWNVGVLKKDNYISGFTGSAIKDKLKDGTLIGVQDLGRGQVVYLADDPIFRSFWENGKLLFSNAVFLVGQ